MNKKLNLFLIIILLLSANYLFAQDTINRVDAKGAKYGSWQKKWLNGKLKYQGQFNANKPYGTFKHYYETGQIFAIDNYEKNGKVRVTFYHPTGKIKSIGIFINQKKDSIWKYFNEDEKLIAEEIYINSKKNGVFKNFYASGKLSEETNWQNDIQDGSWRTYWENGSVKEECRYVKGDLDGAFKATYPSGKVFFEGNYKKSLKIGTWIYYKENGEIDKKSEYKNGVEQGVKLEDMPKPLPKQTVDAPNGMEGE